MDEKERALLEYPEREDNGNLLVAVVIALNRAKRQGYEKGYLQAINLIADGDPDVVKALASARLFARQQRKNKANNPDLYE